MALQCVIYVRLLLAVTITVNIGEAQTTHWTNSKTCVCLAFHASHKWNVFSIHKTTLRTEKMSSNSTATSGSGSGSAGARSKVKTKKVKSKHKEDEAIELPRVLDYLFEKELINRQNKHIHIMDTFGPSRNTHHLTSKFYARHEQQTPDDLSRYLSFVYGSSYKHSTESNVYGWMPDSVNRPAILKQLNFINAPKQRCCLTKYGEILESDKANARPQFNGLRFFLQ